MAGADTSIARCGLCDQPTGAHHHHLCTHPLARFLGIQIDERHRVDSVLGRGGMGVVFGGVDLATGRRVAIKMLHPALAGTPELFERFRREAELARRLHHPSIVEVLDAGRAKDGSCYYVMEAVEGESLRALVKRSGPLSVARAVYLVEQVGLALGVAHEAGVIHRDLKPHNVMLFGAPGLEQCKVLDFGLVKAVGDDPDEDELTDTGQIVGTPSYMAPEQAAGSPVDPRADLFALGACLYFCLTGSPPCRTRSAAAALSMLMRGQVPRVAQRRIGAPIPEALQSFLDRALACEADDRPQTASQFIDGMKDALSSEPQEGLDARPDGAVAENEQSLDPVHPVPAAIPRAAAPRQRSRPSNSRRVATLAAGAAIALVLLAIGAVVWLR